MLGASIVTVIGIISAASVPTFGRVAHTQTLTIRNHDYILAERAMGASPLRIGLVHILPNIVGPLIISASMEVLTVITLEAFSFLGVGCAATRAELGQDFSDGFSVIRNTPWPVIASGLLLIVITLAFTFLGESLRDTFDPKLRRDV